MLIQAELEDLESLRPGDNGEERPLLKKQLRFSIALRELHHDRLDRLGSTVSAFAQLLDLSSRLTVRCAWKLRKVQERRTITKKLREAKNFL